jgi:hypothetical protein
LDLLEPGAADDAVEEPRALVDWPSDARTKSSDVDLLRCPLVALLHLSGK